MVLGMKTVLNQRWLRPDLLCFLSSLSSLVLCAAWDEVFLTSLIPRYAEIMRKCGEYHGDIMGEWGESSAWLKKNMAPQQRFRISVSSASQLAPEEQLWGHRGWSPTGKNFGHSSGNTKKNRNASIDQNWSWTSFFCVVSSNVSKTKIDHPPVITIYRWYMVV